MSEKNLFWTERLSDFLEKRCQQAMQQAKRVSKETLRDQGVKALVQSIAHKFCVEPLVLHPEDKTSSTTEVEIDISQHRDYDFESSTCPGLRYTVHVPFTGMAKLFRFRPSTYTSRAPRGHINTKSGTLDILMDFRRSSPPEQMKTQFNEHLEYELKHIGEYIEWQSRDLARFAVDLQRRVSAELQQRWDAMHKSEGVLEALGIPLAPRAGSPQLPVQLNQTIDLRQAATVQTVDKARGAEPERIITEDDYKSILSLIRHQCRTFEQAPGAFSPLLEEALRDVVRASLNAVYRGTTAEAFRKHGKTDLCVGTESGEAFVAECKVWKGEKELVAAIDQLFGYLTWRDGKAAIVIFNKKSKNFDALKKKVLPVLEAYPGYVRTSQDNTDQGEWRVIVRHGEGHLVTCHVMLFNLHV